MANNILVINVDLRETRVALIENGVIAELQIERAAHRGTVGNVVLGKVSRVLPGMQAAFIEIGQERAAFLHVEDLIRPDDFEAYLLGDAREAEEGSFRGDGTKRGKTAPRDAEGQLISEESGGAVAEAVAEDEDEDEDLSLSPGADDAAEDDDEDDDLSPLPGTGVGEAADEDDEDDEDDEEDEEDDEEGDGPEDAAQAGETADASNVVAAGQDAGDASPGDGEAPSGDTGTAGVAPPSGDTAREGGAPTSTEAAEGSDATEAASDRLERGGRRRRRRRGGDKRPAPTKVGTQKKTSGQRRTTSSRVARSVPITEVVKEGDEVVVQISKEPIGTKGARVTSHISLAGRYVVYLPTVEHVGVSKRIGSARERSRLRKVIDAVKPPRGGLIVRTVAEGLTKKKLKSDIGYLIKVWAEVAKQKEGAKSPRTLYTELDLVLKVARDLFTDEIQHIVIDDKEEYARLVRFIEMFLPDRVKDIQLYTGDEPIFDAYGIEDEISRALSRKVPLPSGGYLILDQAEALTAIDVNTGRYVGKGSRDLEETALKTNLEAVEEIAYQLRFRNIGGLVILDLIDMDRAQNRDKVLRSLEQRLAKDKAKTTLNRISDLGLVEMTRKRTRESLGRVMHEPCFYCDGTGQIQSRATIAYEILRQVRRERETLPGYSVVVNAHPAVIDFLRSEAKDALVEAERRFMRRIETNPRAEYHIEQYDLQGK